MIAVSLVRRLSCPCIVEDWYVDMPIQVLRRVNNPRGTGRDRAIPPAGLWIGSQFLAISHCGVSVRDIVSDFADFFLAFLHFFLCCDPHQ
jgi:hypothetical protein